MTPPAEQTFAAILAAGGRGTRFSAGSGKDQPPKQFLKIAGYPTYVWPLNVLLENPRIDHIVIVAPAELVPIVEEQVAAVVSDAEHHRLSIVPGGDTRQASVYEGLRALEAVSPTYVLIHDAARPFLTDDILENVLDGVIKYGAVTTGIPPADTIKKISGEFIEETIPRETLLLVQTPQAARYEWLINAHDQALAAGNATTDDAAVLEACGHKVGIVRGATYNLKITQPEDLILAEALASIVFSDRL